MNARLRSFALLATLLVGCASPTPSPTPLVAKSGEVVRSAQSAKAEPGISYPIEIGTHCGVGKMPVDFDGSFWVPAADLPERAAGVANPADQGEIRLTGPNAATYASPHGAVIDLVRVEPGPRLFALCR
jgi:hypothetical protein